MIGFIPVKDEADRVSLIRLFNQAYINNVESFCQSSRVLGIAFNYNDDTLDKLRRLSGLDEVTVVEGVFQIKSHTAEIWVNRPGLLQQVASPVAFCSDNMNWKWERKATATKLLTEFAEAIGRPVRFRVPHGEPVSVRSDDDRSLPFEILVWSSPHEGGRHRPPEYMWGFETVSRREGYHPSGEGIAIIDEATGWCVAELFPHQLYVHHDLCHHNYQSELNILERLLTEVLSHMSPAAIDPAILLLRQFTALCNRGRTLALKETQARIEADESILKRLEAEVVQVRGRLTGRKLKRAQLEGVVHEADRQLAVLEALQNHSMAIAVKIEHGVIEVITARLYAIDRRTSIVHRLGAQTVTMHPDGKNGGVRFVCREGNISGTGRAVPHVTKAGFIAHPDAVVAITELLARQQFDEVFDLAVQSATEVMTDYHQGVDVAKWPPATPAELVGTEWEGQQVTVAA